MYHFCTYFDKNFLTRGLGLYFSLKKQNIEFRFFILCLDKETYEILKKLNYSELRLIKLSQIEIFYPDLISVKEERTKVEYYWTLTPFLLLFILKKWPSIDTIAYLDADLYFYNNPKYLYKEFGNNSVFIIPHRLKGLDKKYEKRWGKYNVGLIMFRNDKNGTKCLNWWSDKCLEWCYYKVEENRAGDQKYLDYFSQLFEGVLSSKNHGAGIGNWNLHYYNYHMNRGHISISPSNEKVIFCHFNQVMILNKYGWIINKSISKTSRILLKPYANSIYKAIKKVEEIQTNFQYGYENNRFRLFIYGLINRQLFKGE